MPTFPGCRKAFAIDSVQGGLIVVAALALLLGGCGGRSQPQLNGTIAFMRGSERGDVNSIGAMTVGAGGSRTLARGANVSVPLRWSPDGRKLVFTMWRDGRPGRLYVVGSEGRNLRRLTGPKYEDDINPAWSPDGRRIVFDAQGDGWTDLRVVNADGSGERKLTTGSYLTGDVAKVAGGDAWSPDGRSIAYVDRRGRLAVMKPDGSNRRRLKGPPLESGGASWSPNGREIVYDAGDEIAVVNADGTGLRNALPPGRSPAWSPDGRKIVFVCAGDVCVVNSDGTGLRTVGRDGATPSWSPDGRWIVYASFKHRAGDIYVVQPDGLSARQLTNTKLDEADPVWSPIASS